MKKVILERSYGEKQTTGKLFIVDDIGLTPAFQCYSLELPNNNNIAGKSCIPAGRYYCNYTYSESLKCKTYEVMNVRNRSGIRIHNGNYTSQIRGCILLGDSHADINRDGITDVRNSKKTVFAFEKKMEKEEFELHIV